MLELSLREALQLGHNYIGTEHMLLGLCREGQGVGAQVLVTLGVDLSNLRRRVLELLGVDPATIPDQPLLEVQAPPRCPSCRQSLAGQTVYQVLDASNEDGGDPISVTVVYCGHCGISLGLR